MASLPYPLNLLYTHIVSVIATTQSACILMSVWVWQGCHTLLQIPILLFLKNLFFCLFKNNMFSCSLVFSKTTCSHVLLSFQTTTCSHVLKTKTCPHVLLSFKNNMFFCLSPKRAMLSIQSCLYVAQKKRLRATLPAVKP